MNTSEYNKSVFVTGGSGFVGKHLITVLVDRGYKVYALTRSKKSAEVVIQYGASPVMGDLESIDALTEGMRSCFAVIHCASTIGVNVHDPKQLYKDNVEGARSVVNCARNAGVKRFVYVSSVTVLLGKHPIVNATEDAPLPPENEALSAYSLTKAQAELVVLGREENEKNIDDTQDSEQSLILERDKITIDKGKQRERERETKDSRMETIIVRLPSVWGAMDPVLADLVTMVNRLWWLPFYPGLWSWIGGSNIVFSTLHVKNAAWGLVLALEKGGNGEIYHLRDDEVVTFRDYYTERFLSIGVPRKYLTKNMPTTLMWGAVVFLECMWSVFRISRGLPIPREGVFLATTEFSCSCEKAKKRTRICSRH
eukprot:TRINITY_DN6278_c0_g1_i1.p1 TRINITY_DN6278_c0_g1~~TRINITY_DN6278_c0_g1_i1.p1  ORF type:complete len:389 (+),score=76.53 TRINITY_DN6278_c0_g1_i1:64-1167(+)